MFQELRSGKMALSGLEACRFRLKNAVSKREMKQKYAEISSE